MRIGRTAILIGLLGAILVLPPGSRAQVGVDCDRGETIGAALSGLRTGDTLPVSGICQENVLIPPGMSGVTLDGQGRATIMTSQTAASIILILGREITVKGFTLIGGRNGIIVLRGASATIDGNIIRDTGRGGQPGSGLGINVGQHSFAGIVNNVIEDNRRIGILVHESSSARIGFIDVALAAGAPNTIRNNGEDGIRVSTSSNARILASIITNNGRNGVRVEKGSQIEAANNLITGNGEDGILSIGSSGVDMDIGGGAVALPNRSDPADPNAGYGIRCLLGGYVAGPLGTLSGNLGPAQIDATCADALQR